MSGRMWLAGRLESELVKSGPKEGSGDEDSRKHT